MRAAFQANPSISFEEFRGQFATFEAEPKICFGDFREKLSMLLCLIIPMAVVFCCAPLLSAGRGVRAYLVTLGTLLVFVVGTLPLIWREVDNSAGIFYGLFFLLIPTAMGAVILYVRMREETDDSGLCRKCGYDLRYSPERCPECGTERHANPDRFESSP